MAGQLCARSFVPALAREALGSLIDQLRMAQAQILTLEKKLTAWHCANEASRRLETIPGVGVIAATALVATILCSISICVVIMSTYNNIIVSISINVA